MNNIQKIRIQYGISQEKLAQLMNVTQNTISNWETEKTHINSKNLLKLSEIFNIPIDKIIEKNTYQPIRTTYKKVEKQKKNSSKIKALRIKQKISQEQLAVLCGVTQKAISHWEQNRNGIDNQNLKKLSQIFNVSVDEIMDNISDDKKNIKFANFNNDLTKIGFSIDQYDLLNDNEKELLLSIIKTFVQSLNKSKN